MIDSRTQMVGIMGWPVEHSLSPVMHNAAFRALGVNWRYVPLPVVPGAAAAAARGLMALGFRGANVTAPHKSDVIEGVDRLSEEAEAIGAVNTLHLDGSGNGSPRLVGSNTDLAGFLDGLDHAGFDPKDRRAVIVGAGGAARAAAYGLLRAGARLVTVLSRKVERAERLVEDLGVVDGRLSVDRLTDRALVEATESSSLLVNTTPVGMWPDTERSIWPDEEPFPRGTLAYDLVYVPSATKLLRQAGAAGAPCLEGLRMFVMQGARALELWTGLEAPIDVMMRACETALGEGGG